MAFLGIAYMKASPTTHVLHFKSGVVKQEGPGLSFFYYQPSSTIVAVPLASADLPFVFNDATADFQPITVQGQLSYRVRDPRRLAALLDHSVGEKGQYRSEDPKLLGERLITITQTLSRAVIGKLGLREALVSSDAIIGEIAGRLAASEAVNLLGVEVLSFTVLSLKPTPEMARALEAEAREMLQRKSDDAIYARRNAAVEHERRIKESELSTEIAVEEKKRKIRETQMAAEIAVEQQRAALIDQRVENERKDADSKSYALERALAPIKELEQEKLLAIVSGGADPKLMIALAFRQLAQNAGKIGELNISPDLLSSLMNGKK